MCSSDLHALRRFASIAGLDVERLEAYGGIGAVIGDVAAKGLGFFAWRARERLLGRPGQLLSRSIDKVSRLTQRIVFYSFSSSARHSRAPRSARKFPLGYVAVLRKPMSREASGR